MLSKFIIVLSFHSFLSVNLLPAKAQQTWIKAGYSYSANESPISDINSTLFTHLLCAFADLNASSYRLSISSKRYFSTFTETVKQKNPSVYTLVSVGGGDANYSTYSSMVSNSSHRKSFIDSSIKIARLYGFHGLDLSWPSASTSSDMNNLGILFEEWRTAVTSEARNNSGQAALILTATVPSSPHSDLAEFPINSVRRNLDWVHVKGYDYYMPREVNFTCAPAALYDPASPVNTDYGITAWINGGLSANKMVLGLPFFGYAWTLLNSNDNAIGAPANGSALTADGTMSYKNIKDYIRTYEATVMYNATYVMNYCVFGSAWIAYDDVEVVKIKVSYAKNRRLLGYSVWQVPNDENWVLSQAAAGVVESNNGRQNRRLLAIILPTTAIGVLLLGLMICYLRRRNFKSKGIMDAAKSSKERVNNVAAAGDFGRNVPNIVVYSLADIEAATDKFSIKNKLGQGGYGPVYRGILADGREIAVKKLSKSSSQGYEEFKNEVTLTAKLQHVNLVKVIGFCIDREEQMLIYEYMPNKSLDNYLFDPVRRYILDWKKRVDIIEGVTQGLLYLQEYSRLTIIHRDLKAGNILLDDDMKPKISDFGMARIFTKDEVEANTSRIVGTYGYVPPEYVKQGIYSTKMDVYSFGVLLLQIISGKRNSCLHGPDENLSLLEFAYGLWKDGKGMEFVDQTLDDTSSSCKLMRCMQIALLCVQENPIDRPSMLEVSSMLKNEALVVMMPKKPAFSTQSHEDQEQASTSRQEIFSVADQTMSEVVGR